jgi:hypothetical protein
MSASEVQILSAAQRCCKQYHNRFRNDLRVNVRRDIINKIENKTQHKQICCISVNNEWSQLMLNVVCKILHICALGGFKNYQALIKVVKSSLIRFCKIDDVKNDNF